MLRNVYNELNIYFISSDSFTRQSPARIISFTSYLLSYSLHRTLHKKLTIYIHNLNYFFKFQFKFLIALLIHNCNRKVLKEYLQKPASGWELRYFNVRKYLYFSLFPVIKWSQIAVFFVLPPVYRGWF
jgi:hypothetical protein